MITIFWGKGGYFFFGGGGRIYPSNTLDRALPGERRGEKLNFREVQICYKKLGNLYMDGTVISRFLAELKLQKNVGTEEDRRLAGYRDAPSRFLQLDAVY